MVYLYRLVTQIVLLTVQKVIWGKDAKQLQTRKLKGIGLIPQLRQRKKFLL